MVQKTGTLRVRRAPAGVRQARGFVSPPTRCRRQTHSDVGGGAPRDSYSPPHMAPHERRYSPPPQKTPNMYLPPAPNMYR